MSPTGWAIARWMRPRWWYSSGCKAPSRPAGPRLVAAAAAAAAGARARGCCAGGDRVAGRGHDVPRGAESVDALAVGVAGVLVLLEQVERVAVVGHLRLAVGARRRTDLRGGQPAADRRLAARPDRRPSDCAGAGARALGPGVLLEEVHGAALRIDQDLAEARARLPDRYRLSVGGPRRSGRGGCVVVVAAAAGGDRQRGQRHRERYGQEVDGFAATHCDPSRGCWRRRSVGLAVAAVVGHGATLWPTTEEGLRPRSYSSCAASESGAKENCRAIQLRPPRRSTRESSRPAASIIALSEMMLPAGAGVIVQHRDSARGASRRRVVGSLAYGPRRTRVISGREQVRANPCRGSGSAGNHRVPWHPWAVRPRPTRQGPQIRSKTRGCSVWPKSRLRFGGSRRWWRRVHRRRRCSRPSHGRFPT